MNKTEPVINPFNRIYKKINSQINVPPYDRLPDFPLLVDIEITNFCNLKCIMCGHTYMKRKQEMMTDDTFKKIIDQCKPYKPGIRFILYSEPFLHPDILRFVQYVKESGLFLHITTNGTVITKEHIDALIEIGLDSITFSMQGLTEEEYAFIRKNNTLPIITEKIKYLVKRRGNNPFVQVSTTISERDSTDNIDKFVDKWSPYADLVTIGKTSWGRITKKNPDIYRILDIKPVKKIKYMPCQIVLAKLGVYVNGDISACCDDAEGRFAVFGNVLKDDIKKVWNSEVYNGLRLLLRNMRMDMLDFCKDCSPAYDLREINKT